ncbi:MAG: glycosyltransferase family 1 protein [bacterium]|nr:glycosyltransferase family 1 protein [bacterium]
MKIGVDISQIAFSGTGVARYTTSLIETLLKMQNNITFVFFYSSLRQPIPKNIEKLILKKHILKKYPLPPILLSFIWNDLHIFPIELFIGKVDLFFSSDWTEPPTQYAKKMTTIHDLVIYKFPETSNKKIIDTQKKRLHWVLKESKIILCDSISTQNDIMEIYNINKNKLKVVYPSVKKITISKNQISEFNIKYSRINQFILSVGKQEPRKNISTLINAFNSCNIQNLDLYIVGPEGWSQDKHISNVPYRVNKNVKFLGYVPDEELSYLYSKALAFFYPSLYEGFGYPVIEAMHAGCPVATSNTSSLKEITKGYGLLFNPHSENEIALQIKNLYNNEQLRSDLIKKGSQRAQYFSEDSFSDQLLSILKEIT